MASLLVNRAVIRSKLAQISTIAMLGASVNSERPSHHVMALLLQKGFKVIPVNPGLAGQDILGQKVVSCLAHINHPVDMVDIFRNNAAVPSIVEEVLALPVLPQLLWMQLGVIHEEAARHAVAAGIDVVMNRCPAIEMADNRPYS